MKKIINVSLITFMALVTVACHHEKKPTRPEVVRVETMVADASTTTSSRPYVGLVAEASSTALSFSVAGTVKSINVNVGSRVGIGSVIATIDNTTLTNTYDMAKAALSSAQDAYNRMKILHDENSLADMQWVSVQNALKEAQSAEAIARKGLNDARLTSPISGYVSEKYVDAGMTVGPGIPVVKVVTIDPVEVKISVSENEIGNIVMGQGATVTSSSLPGKTFNGKVIEKGVSANIMSRAYDVKIRLEASSANGFLPGMICDVTLDQPTNAAEKSSVILPVRAVLLDADNKNFVWLDSSSIAVKRIVEIGGMTNGGIEIVSGINPGDSVIVNGQQKVSTGMKVISTNH